jgi:tetratricopeptide (TPR) repeat protein
MSYPGNASLPPAVKDRVISTFQQTLALHKQGRRDEVISGCNLMLQMDASFEPARKLLEKARDPGLPIDVDNLLNTGAGPIEQVRQAMAARDFQRAIQITTEILTDDLMNDEARVLGDEAREKLEAGPFIDQFVRKCDQHLASGNLAAAKADIEKARQLDPTHPDVVRIGREIVARDAMAAPAAPAAPASGGFSFDASPSFIVDDASKQAPSTRSTAQASDFGFTFEEEKSPGGGGAGGGFANFSFDSPAPGSAPTPAPAASPASSGFSFDAPAKPAGDAFDFATASITTTPEDQRKIDQYLTDGDRAFDSGDYQQAIDTWSRIFLIDVTNDAASERIERAKGKRREIEDRVEVLLASAVAAFERKDKSRARADFAEVLRVDPNNTTAQEFMARLTDTAVEGGAFGTETPYIPPPDEKPLNLDYLDDDASSFGEVLMPPSPGARPSQLDEADEDEEEVAPKKGAKKAPPKKAAATGRKLPMGAIAAVLAVLVLGAGGWFAWNRFMNKPEADPAATQAIFARASMLADRGQFDQAIKILQNVQPTDPEHDKALQIIADLQKKKSSAAQLIDGKPAEEFYTEKMSTAQAAFDAHDYGTAKADWEQAMRVKPLSAEARANYDAATQQVAKLDAAKALMQERKYTDAIVALQALREADPSNLTVQRMISNAHFNLGATALQEEKLDDAVRQFDEVLKITPDDELARRSRELAQRYEGRSKDLLYRIYVKYLPMR